MAATVLDSDPGTPQAIHNCPNCSHWLPDGTLACPDCHTLIYGQHLGAVAYSAQQLEQQGRWAEARERWRSALSWLPENTQQAASIQQHIAQIDRRFAAEEEQKARWTRRLGPFAPIVLFILKYKSAIFILFKLKFLLSFLAFFGIYWALFGWKFALGFTVCLGIHEMGHYIAVRRRGLKADLPVFFPGMGAYVRWYHQGVTREVLSAVALAGPLYGLGAALACMALWWGTHSTLFLVLANVGAWINLFNLIPVLGLDGAQATYALSRMQRGLISAACWIFFALTVSVSGGYLFAPTTQWVFAFVGLGMLWRCFTNDEPKEGHTGTMIYFLGLLLALGFLLLVTIGPINSMEAIAAQTSSQPAGYWF